MVCYRVLSCGIFQHDILEMKWKIERPILIKQKACNTYHLPWEQIRSFKATKNDSLDDNEYSMSYQSKVFKKVEINL